MSRTISTDKVAVKSGYYFWIFNKDEIPSTLKKTRQKVKMDNIIYDLYQGTSLEDERKIDNMFGDRMGIPIDDYIIEKPKCKLVGENGNIFNLMGIASRVLKKNDLDKDAKEMCERITTKAKSYGEALSIIAEYVQITDKEETEDEQY